MRATCPAHLLHLDLIIVVIFTVCDEPITRLKESYLVCMCERERERDLEHSNRGDLGLCSVVVPKGQILFAVEMHILIITKDYSTR